VRRAVSERRAERAGEAVEEPPVEDVVVRGLLDAGDGRRRDADAVCQLTA